MAAIPPRLKTTRKKLVKRAAGTAHRLCAAPSIRVPGAQRLDRNRVLSLRALLRNRRTVLVRRPSRRRGGLAAGRRADEPQGAAHDRPRARPPPRGHVSADRFSGGIVAVPQELLRVAVSGGNRLRVSLASGAAHFRPKFPPAARARYRLAQPEIHPAGPVSVRGRLDAGRLPFAPFSRAPTAWWTTSRCSTSSAFWASPAASSRPFW